MPAHQYVKTPHSVNAQPIGSAQPMSTACGEPSSSSGNPYSRQSVAALPRKLTGSGGKSYRRSTSSAAASTTSLATRAAASHHGMMSRATKATNGASTYSRSAAGSSRAPSRLVWFSSRASRPSSQSDTPEKTSTPRAATSACGPSSSQQNSGTPSSRRKLSRLG